MSFDELLAITPQILLSITALALLIQASIKRSASTSQTVAMIGLLLTLISVLSKVSADKVQVTMLLLMDAFSSFYIVLVLIAAISVVMLQKRYIKNASGRNEVSEEFYVLLILATLGGSILIAASHAASLFLGLELMSVSILAMLGYNRSRQLPLESAIKYLVLSAGASAFLLFGLALLYASSGSLELTSMLQGQHPMLSLIGLAMLIIGLGFKLSLVPFHWWTPDVYQGAPMNSTMFLATVSKTAVFAVLLRVLLNVDDSSQATPVLSIMAISSMVLGNLLALQQQNLKRLMAYSAIAHMGYVLVAAIVAIDINHSLAIEGSSYYLLAYLIASIIVFSVLTVYSNMNEQEDCEQLETFKGFFWHHPWLATAFTLAVLSMAGMPITVGFIGKFYLLTLAVDLSAWWLVGAMVVGSVIGLYYYLRVIFTLFQTSEQTSLLGFPSGIFGKLWIGAATATLLLFGILPGTLGDNLIRILSLNG